MGSAIDGRRLRSTPATYTRLFAALLVVALVVGHLTINAYGANRPKVTITTTVTTTLPNFEFNAYFGPSLSPISCELDHDLREPGARPFTEAYCMSATTKLVHHVTLSSSGVVKKCVGPQCGSNPGLGTPDLSPGTMVRSGPFTCVIAAKAVYCTVADGRGFSITLSAIRAL